MFFLQLLQPSKTLVQPLVLILLSFITAGTTGKISVDQARCSKIQLNYSTFLVTFSMSIAQFNVIRFDFGKNRYTAIPFFFVH